VRIISIFAIPLLALPACSPRDQSRRQQPKIEPIQKGQIRFDPVHPFPKATQLRLFVETEKPDRDGKPVYVRPDGRELSSKQREQFERLLRVETPVNVPPDSEFWLRTSCFIPHHFFRYYDSSGRRVGEISVCFCCAGVEMEPSTSLRLQDGQRFEADYVKLKSLVSSWGERTDIQCDAQVS
jgi:hypothetical protein